VRFKDFEFSPIPGPGKYKVKGFAEEALEKAMKYNSIINNPSSILNINKKKEDDIVLIKEIKETISENECE
jgi:hypothetical protein